MKKLLILITLLFPLLTQAQNIAKNADSLLNAYTDKNYFSGVVLIAKNGKTIFSKAYGYADESHLIANTLNTEFRAGSLTKMFTSALILRMVESKQLSLDDPISKYVTNFVNSHDITIKNLLSHTSGISGTVTSNSGDLERMVMSFKSENPYAPGTRFEYNNFNYILLSYIAQKVAGRPYNDLIKRNVFDKVGMYHTGIDYQGRKSDKIALGYTVNPQTKKRERMETANINAASGAGAMFTTVEDLLKWSEAIDKHTILSDKTFALATTAVKPGYGLGWIIGNQEEKAVRIGHTGSIEGFMADFVKFPKDGITIIFLSNLIPSIDVQLSKALVAIAFERPFEIEGPKREINLTTAELARYTGTYKSENEQMVVTIQDGKLRVLAPGGDKAELAAQDINKFFVVGPEIKIEFLEQDGKVTSMKVDVRGGLKFAKVP